jgi:cation:H+ antiporter
MVGLTVVAFGTSSPELVVSLKAGLSGQGGIAVGNVVGSNICNIALILGLCAVIRPMHVQAQLVRMDVPVMIACSTLLAVFLLDGQLARWEGGVLTLGLAAYLARSIRLARRGGGEEPFGSSSLPVAPGGVWGQAAFVGGGLLALTLGANWFVKGAVLMAADFGLSEAVIGLTIVAVGTSLPELATSVVAAVRNQSDMAIGNVVGSNNFNILGILGPVALATRIEANGLSAPDLGVMLVVAVLSLPFMWSRFRLSRTEGLVLLLLYAAYTVYLVYFPRVIF